MVVPTGLLRQQTAQHAYSSRRSTPTADLHRVISKGPHSAEAAAGERGEMTHGIKGRQEAGRQARKGPLSLREGNGGTVLRSTRRVSPSDQDSKILSQNIVGDTNPRSTHTYTLTHIEAASSSKHLVQQTPLAHSPNTSPPSITLSCAAQTYTSTHSLPCLIFGSIRPLRSRHIYRDLYPYSLHRRPCTCASPVHLSETSIPATASSRNSRGRWQ